LRAGSASSREVSYVHGFAAWVVVLLHNLDHFIAIFVHFDKSELDILLGKLSHLILNFVPVRRAIWVAIIGIAYVFAMTWSISYKES